MTQIIDRRKNGQNRSAVNRQRFIRRYKQKIKHAVSEAIKKRSISDIEKGELVHIPARDIEEVVFSHSLSGERELVLPGNEEYVKGDRLKRPDQAASQKGQGNKASASGEGIDDFVFELSREEFLDLYFDDLELPDLVKKQLAELEDEKHVRAGYSVTGVPTNINIRRSMRQAIARRKALSGQYKKRLAALQESLHQEKRKTSPDEQVITDIEEKIAGIKRRIDNIPFIDDIDIRYNQCVPRPGPSSQAVMFCIMDVSGSMDETKKDIAKRFFILLYLFLKRVYKNIDIVFIRHHTSAKEVDEEEFFYSRETGGTVVSSALSLLNKIIQERYSDQKYNIYAAQASDGDNWNADSPRCQQILNDLVMPYMQYFAYVEIMPRHHQSLWDAYQIIQSQHEHFAMQHITSITDIYPVFRDLFKRQG